MDGDGFGTTVREREAERERGGLGGESGVERMSDKALKVIYAASQYVKPGQGPKVNLYREIFMGTAIGLVGGIAWKVRAGWGARAVVFLLGSALGNAVCVCGGGKGGEREWPRRTSLLVFMSAFDPRMKCVAEFLAANVSPVPRVPECDLFLYPTTL